MDKTKETSKIRAIRGDVIIDKSLPEPVTELVKEIKWLYDEALSGNLRELAYSASDTGTEPIYKIVGDSVNYPMMYTTLEVLKHEYFENVVLPSTQNADLGDIDE